MSTKVFLPDILEALQLATDESSSYVHRATGRVVTVFHDALRLAEDAEDDDPDLPAWQKNAVAETREVLGDGQWLPLPSTFDVHEWELMDDFVRSVADPAERGELADAIRGRGAFRRFKDTIRRLGREQAWYAHRDAALEEIARDWLEENGFEAVTERPVAEAT
jgi:hypothetical protein